MREAHEIGLPSSATMMYGHVESDSDIATHFELVSSLQQKTGGLLMAFMGYPRIKPNNRYAIMRKIDPPIPWFAPGSFASLYCLASKL